MTFVIVVSQPSQLYELECVKLVVLDEAAVLPASFLLAPGMEELLYLSVHPSTYYLLRLLSTQTHIEGGPEILITNVHCCYPCECSRE